jgi:hypothetical protein
MPLFRVTANWIHEEVRVVEAKNAKDAAQKIRNGDYDTVIDWNLTDFINVDLVHKMTPAEVKQYEYDYMR